MKPGMSLPGEKPDSAALVLDQFAFQMPITPHYSHLDTERHVNNVAVQSFYTEVRTRFMMAELGPSAWYSDSVLLRPARTLTQFLGEIHYLDPVTAAVTPISVDREQCHLRLALFQNGVCVGLQDCLLGAWQDEGWVPLPAPAREALAAHAGTGEALAWPELADDQGLDAYPARVPLTMRYADLDPDRRLSELALARYAEQARAGSMAALREPHLGLLVARIDLRYWRWDLGLGEAELASGLARVGNTSFVLRGGIRLDGKRALTAESVMVLIDRDTHRPIRVPDWLRDSDLALRG